MEGFCASSCGDSGEGFSPSACCPSFHCVLGRIKGSKTVLGGEAPFAPLPPREVSAALV